MAWSGRSGSKISKKIDSPQDGIISDPQQVKRFANTSGIRRRGLKVTRRFSAKELQALARASKK